MMRRDKAPRTGLRRQRSKRRLWRFLPLLLKSKGAAAADDCLPTVPTKTKTKLDDGSSSDSSSSPPTARPPVVASKRQRPRDRIRHPDPLIERPTSIETDFTLETHGDELTSTPDGSPRNIEATSSTQEQPLLSRGGDTSPTSQNPPLQPISSSFGALRFSYLSVLLVVYLADGLQGTHLYKLYDEYGFSVASLYSLGFFTGGLLAPVTGPIVDQMGRKRAALLYCGLEIFINTIEQYPYLFCLVASRMLGGFTTNLLQCVFETWLDSEFRKQKEVQLRNIRSDREREHMVKQQQHAYELLMRDAVIISNSAAIGSGYLSHILSELSGPVGPFRGAVVCTMAALVVVASMWTENYGGRKQQQQQQQTTENGDDHQNDDSELVESVGSGSIFDFLREAARAFMADMRMLRVGIVQGLSVGSLQIFVYLWSPVLMDLAKQVPKDALHSTWGLDRRGDPAFGLIFMVFMGACVLGGVIAPFLRQAATALLTPIVCSGSNSESSQGAVRPMAVEFLSAACYFFAACMLLIPCMVSGPNGFSQSLRAFAVYELLVGIVSPCEGVIRSIYFPAHARASVWTLPSLLVNAAVSLAVFGTQFISLLNVCMIVVSLMVTASFLQASLITATEWATIKTRVRNAPKLARSLSLKLVKEASAHARKTPHYVRSVSFSVYETASAPPKMLLRHLSDLTASEQSKSSDLNAISSDVFSRAELKDKVD